MDEKRKVCVLSKMDFDKYCEGRRLNDMNVEEVGKDYAFISIICEKDANERYIKDREEHWFKENHVNVLNLEFDDVENECELRGVSFFPISEKQAKETVEFIERNLDKNFIIHCRAGISRSQAIGQFLLENYDGHFVESEFSNPHILHNKRVMKELLKAKYGPIVEEK